VAGRPLPAPCWRGSATCTDTDITVEHEPWDRSLQRALLIIDRMVEAASTLTGLSRRSQEQPPDVEAEEPAHPAPPASFGAFEAPERVAGRSVGPSPGDVAVEVFGPGRSSFEVERIFADRFAGREVFWHGALKQVVTVRSDLSFGGGPGTKALMTVHRLPADLYGGRDVDAVVWLPVESYEHLRDGVGEEISFRGVLLRCDPLPRSLYVAEGGPIEA